MSPTSDFWQHLKQYTGARIALGRTGGSITTKELLDFQLAHARARDAIHAGLQADAIEQQLSGFGLPVIQLASQAANRTEYLQRPDKGRKLNQSSADQLKSLAQTNYDICLVVADGLSAIAIEKNIKPYFNVLLPRLQSLPHQLAPLCLVQQGRVAVGDKFAYLLNCQMVIICIGERPGLSSPDSLGIYLTYQPKPGLTDEMRNCISNIRPGGLPYAFAAEKLLYLVQESFLRKLSGVQLKDEQELRLKE